MQLYFDTFGNIYKEENSEYFSLIIGKDNNILWENVNLDQLMKYEDKNIKYLKMNHIKIKKHLQQHVVCTLIENDEYEEHEDYYPEAQHFEYTDDTPQKIDDEEYGDTYGDDDEESEFCVARCYDTSFIKLFDYYLNEPSSYDTLVVDDTDSRNDPDVEDLENNVIFALESKCQSPYRIIFYVSGKIKLDIIGSHQKFF
jgi:hypothetical protein